LSATAVRASQRERIVRAMLECVAREGYDATTVPLVVATARVSRNAFYEFFDDKTDCFIAVCDQGAEELLGELTELASEPDWIQALVEGVRRYLRWWQERPAFSRAYFLSLPSAGERAFRQRERQYAAFRAIFEDLARRAREEQRELAPMAAVVPRVLVLAITELVAEEVRAGAIDRLSELESDIVGLAARLLADDATARRVLASPRGAPEAAARGGAQAKQKQPRGIGRRGQAA
jgi:AcrR family transcriptional regulator